MFCRAGSPECWTLELQAVLWMSNNASLRKEPVPRRTSVYAFLIEIWNSSEIFLVPDCDPSLGSGAILYTAASEILPHKYFNPQDHGVILQFFHFDIFLSPSFHSPATIRCVHMCIWSLQDPMSLLTIYWGKITRRMWSYCKGFSVLYTSYHYQNPLFPLKPRFPGILR